METERPVRRLTIAINETIVASVAGSSGDEDKGKDIHYHRAEVPKLVCFMEPFVSE